jgi:hypothetical protein
MNNHDINSVSTLSQHLNNHDITSVSRLSEQRNTPRHNEDGNEKSENARALNALNRSRRRRRRRIKKAMVIIKQKKKNYNMIKDKNNV